MSEDSTDTTTQYDRSPYGNDGVLNGGVACNETLGNYGNACEFDGSNDYIELNNGASLQPTDAITIEAWFKRIGSSGLTRIVDTSETAGAQFSGYRLGVSGSSLSIIVGFGGSSRLFITDDVGITDNIWTHLVITYDGSQLKAYKDGQLVGTPQSNTSAIDYTGVGTTKIGTIGFDASGQFFNGTIDEVRLYDRALSQEEIRTHYLRGTGSGASGAITADKFRIVNTSGVGSMYSYTESLSIATTYILVPSGLKEIP